MWRLGRLCPPYKAVNLSHFTVPDMSQIKGLRPPKTSKIEKIYILYGLFLCDAVRLWKTPAEKRDGRVTRPGRRQHLFGDNDLSAARPNPRLSHPSNDLFQHKAAATV
jgi:hypothetical protein